MACKNCNHVLSEDDKFCNNCGGQVIQNRFTVKNLFTEFHETFFSWEANKPIRTFIDLFIIPEQVIDGYINGVRKKYLSPFGYIVISLTLTGLFFFIALKFYPEVFDSFLNTPGEEGQQMESIRDFQHSVYEYNSLILLALLPVFAFISWIVFYNKRKYNYAEHLILNLYAYSHVAIVSTLILFMSLWINSVASYVSFLAIVIQFLYYSYILKSLFKLTWKQLLIKILYFLVLLFPIYIILGIIAAIIMFATGNFDALIEAAKAQSEIS